VVLAGEGGRALSSGQDLEELAAIDLNGIVNWQREQKLLLDSFRKLTKPFVTAIEGICVGLGFHMALCTDWRVAPETSTWGQPEVKVGLASIVGPYLINLHVGRTHNLQLSLMAELISGQKAHEVGLLTELCDENDALVVAIKRAKRMAALPRNAVRLTKERYCALTQSGFDEAFAAGVEAQKQCFAAGEPQRLIAAFLAKRDKAAAN
jgi:enoyl-CoA hydratase/carnithine racemase